MGWKKERTVPRSGNPSSCLFTIPCVSGRHMASKITHETTYSMTKHLVSVRDCSRTRDVGLGILDPLGLKPGVSIEA